MTRSIGTPDVDHKSKLDHLREMLQNAVTHKRLPFRVVLMDSWLRSPSLRMEFA